MEDPDGGTAFRRLKRGVVKGISFGFLIPDDPAAVSYDGRRRRLKQVYLLEVSLVAVLAQPAAQAVAVKSIEAARHLIERLRGEIAGEVIQELKAIRRHLDAVIPSDPSADGDDTVILPELQGIAASLGI